MQHSVTQALLVLLAAMVGGFCSSAPLGAINLWITDRVLAQKTAHLRWFLIGVIGMDCVHASFAAWGYHAFVSEGPVARWLSVAGGAFLIILGSLSLLKKAKAKQEECPDQPQPSSGKRLSDFLLGAFMCGANPAFLMFWVFAINQVERHVGCQIIHWRLAVFLGGVALGDGMWFKVLLRVVRKGRDAFRPTVLASVRTTIAAAFVLVGTLAIVHGFKLR